MTACATLNLRKALILEDFTDLFALTIHRSSYRIDGEALLSLLSLQITGLRDANRRLNNIVKNT